MADNQEFAELTRQRQAISMGLNAEDVVNRGLDTNSVVPDVDSDAYIDPSIDRSQFYEKPELNVPGQESKTDDTTGFWEDYKAQQVNAWNKFYSTEEDTLIEAKKLSNSLGVSESLILTNDETLEQARTIFKAQQKNLDMGQVFKENPALATLAKDGNATLAAIAMNHLPEVKEQKALIQTIRDQWRVAEIQNELNMMGRAEMDGGAPINFEKVKQLQQELVSLKAPNFSDDPLGSVIGGVVGQLPQMYRSTLKGIERGTQFATGGAISAAVLAAPTVVGSAPAAIGGAGAGFALGMKAGYGEGSYNEMVGSNYLDLRAERNSDGTYKYSKDQSRVIAAAQAGASAFIETVTLDSVLGTLGNAKGVYASQIKDIIKNATTKEAGVEALRSWVANIGKVTWEESREEGLQSISDDLIRNAGDFIFGKNISNSTRDIFNNAAENFIEAVPASMGFGIIGAGGAMSSALVRKAARALQLDNQNKFNETKTGKGIELINSLKQSMANSKLFKSDKETATEVLKNNLAGSGFEKVYVDSAELRQDGQIELLGKVVDALDISDEKKQAILEGRENIESAIPTETFMQVAVETDEKLNEYISFDANAFSFAKNKRYAETIKKEIDALKNVDLKEQKEIESIILDNGFAPEEREAAERFINQYGFGDAGKMVNASLKAVNEKIQQIIDRNMPASEILDMDYSAAYTVKGKGLGYYTNTEDEYVDEGYLGGDIAEEQKNWTWHKVDTKMEPQWLQSWRANNFGRFTNARRNQMIIDAINGNNPYDIWGMAPTEQTLQDQKELASLLPEQQKLEKLKAGFDNIANNEAIVTRGLSKEGYQVYREIMAQLKNAASPEASAAAQFNAVLLARHADRFAQIVRDFTGKEYTAIDYINDYVVVKTDGKSDKRGSIDFFENGKAVISLFEKADQSTFTHEMGHLFLRDLERLAAMEGVPEQVVKDYNTVKEWTSYNPKQLEEYSGTASYREFETRHKAIQKAIREGDKKLEEKLKYEWAQERWARGWEQYLREGKAPTSSLQRVFRTFKKWLNGIYRDFIQVGGAPSPDVKAVMDRMIATQDEIDLQAERASHASFIRAGGLNFLAEDNQALFEKYWAQAQEEAAEKVLKVAMQDVQENMAKERAEVIAGIREAVTEDADNNTVLTISRMVEEEPSALETCLETAKMTKEEYEAELKRLGGSYEAYIKQQVDAQVKELGDITEVGYENIKAAAEQAIENGEYCDKLYEFEIAAMVQKGAAEQRIGKMADEKFAAIEKALSGIDAKADTSKKIGILQQRINDLRYTIRWNEAETKMLLDIQEAAAKAKLEAEKIEHKAEKAQLKHDIKEAQYNQRWREAELNLIIDGLQGKLKDKIEDFNQYRKEQREGLRVVRDAEKGWVAETRKFLNQTFSTDYSIKDIGGERKRRSEARSHRYDSMQLMAKGEWQAAAQAKRGEVVSNILADLARKAQKQMDSVEAGLKKKLKTLKKNDHIAANQRYLFQILMQSFGYAEKAEYAAPTEWTNANQLLMEMANAGYEMEFYDLLGQPMVERDGNNNVTGINLPQWLTDAMNGKETKPEDLSMAQLRDFNNFMKMLYKSGSKQMVLDKDGKKIELDAAGAAIRAQANERMAKIQEVGKGKAHQEETWKQHFARLARKGNANILQTETVLEMMGPLAHNLVYQRITDAAMNELRALGETTKKLQKLMDETLGVNSKAFLEGKYRFGDEVVTGSELLAIALNCGTESNKRRVVSSFNVTEEQINEALSNLTDNEWKFVEGVWAMFEENWPKIADVQISITGGMAKKEQAQAFTVKDKNGVVHEIKGGYYPIRYDSRQGTRTRQLEASNNIRAASNTAAGKNTGTGMTKERVANVSDQVLSTNLGLVSSMLAEQVHFINMRQAYLDARAVVNNKEFKNAVIEQFGTDMQAVMENWVESQWADPRPASELVDQAGRWARTALTLGALSFRVTTALINVANIATVSLYLGPQNTIKALRGFYKVDGNIMARKDEILSKSVFLAQRAEVFDANIRENVKKSVGIGKWNKMKQEAQDLLMLGFKPIMMTDMMLALPTWQFEYERVLREADPTKKTAEQIETDAIRAGDKAVRKCFGSGMKQDITKVQRGSEFTKMLTTFYSYFAVVHNLVASKVAEGRRAEYQGKGAVAKWAPIANAVLCEYIIQSLIDSAVRQGMNAIGEDEWDWEKFWKKSATNVADNMFGAIPGLRDIVPRFLESMMGERVQDVRIPLIDVGQKAINVAKDIKNEKKDKIDVAYDCAKLLSVTSGFSDPLLNAVPTTMRFIAEYEKQDLFEYLKAVLLSKKLKSKE